MTLGDGEAIIISNASKLATLSEQTPGTRVQVAGSGHVFHCAGRIKIAVAEILGLEQQNVWVPDPALQFMIRRHLEFSDHVRALSLVLGNPRSVHIDEGHPDTYRFYADADQLRGAHTLTSTSVRAVDALIELRLAGGQTYLRAFHLSPMRKPKGVKVWP